jgi:hypothetical protein
MKSILVLLLGVCFSTASFSAPWDFNVGPRCHTRSFTDPYVTNYGAYVVGSWSDPNYALNIQVSLDHSAPVKWLVTIQVYGQWQSGTGYKSFDIVFNSGQWHKSINFPMYFTEVAYTGTAEEIYEGPY